MSKDLKKQILEETFGEELTSGVGKKKKEERVQYTASFPELVDLVLDGEGLAFLLKDGSVTTEITLEDKIYLPPPLAALPNNLLFPRLEQVVEQAQKHTKTGESGELGDCKGCRDLYDSLVQYHKNISDLPDKDLYDLLALWDFHTYTLERSSYSPIIYFFSIAERGKSRTLKGLTYIAYRGIRKGDIRDSQLLRDCTHLRATLAFDMTDFWEKVKSSGSADVILNRFEKGITVSRVNRPEKGAFQDTDYYDVFGPTIIATNELISDIADTRAIPIVMTKSRNEFEGEVSPESSLPYKEALVAYRLIHITDDWQTVPKIAKSRLGDITRPLYQIVKNVYPEKEETLLRLIKNIETSRITVKANSIDSEILQAWVVAKSKIDKGVIATQVVADVFNNYEREREERLTVRRIGTKLKSFGFTYAATKQHTSGYIWETGRTEDLLAEYGMPPIVTPESPESPEKTPPQVQEGQQELSGETDGIAKMIDEVL